MHSLVNAGGRMIVSFVYRTGWDHLLIFKNKLIPAFPLLSCVICAPGWGTDYITLHTAVSLTADTHIDEVNGGPTPDAAECRCIIS